MSPLNSESLKGLLPSWLLKLAIIFFIALASLTVGWKLFSQAYQNKILPNVLVGDLNLSGLNADEARQLINREVDKINQQGVIFRHKGKGATVWPVVASTNADLAYSIINFNVEAATNEAVLYGHGQSLIFNLANAARSLTLNKTFKIPVTVNRQAVEKILSENFAEAITPAEDAALKYNKSGTEYEFFVTPEKIGKTIDFEAAVGALIENLAELKASPIELKTVTQYPKISLHGTSNIDVRAKEIMAAPPLNLVYEDLSWTIVGDELANLLSLTINPANARELKVGLDEIKTKEYLKAKVSPKIDRPPLEAKFEILNGKVAEFQNGQDGLSLDLTESLNAMENNLTYGGQVALIVKDQPVLIKAGELNSLGIKEIIGVGTSTFAGSPVNRRHNIRVGAASVNGSLIKPGQEFSLLKTLGQVSSSTGYLPELVIKEGRTIPEYGGGLCQIGTTVFRATLASGLPVTMRQNHSYRVQYYEPAGTDATIYDPWPDYRFINDTANHILIQSKISGDILSFEFWGTHDGRQINRTKPVIYNIVRPQPTKIIETLDLKPGVKKCTELAHNGADAYFDYQVTYADGTVKKRRFSSHYVPWQEVCLSGVEKLSPPPETASSTPPLTAN